MSFFTEFFEAVPWFLPGIGAWIVLSVAALPLTSRVLRTERPVALSVSVTFGVVVLATLTPNAAGLAGSSSHGCDVSRVGLPPLRELTTINDTLRNVALFVPFGFALGLLPWTRRTGVVLGLVLAAPIAIELAQLFAPGLGRGCQSADVIDNATGLAIGLVGATLLRLASGWWQQRGLRTT